MDWIIISQMPTCISRDQINEWARGSDNGAHESILRSWHILAEVKQLLQKGVDTGVILRLIALMERIDISTERKDS